MMGDVKDCISYRDRKSTKKHAPEKIHAKSEVPWILIIHGNFRRNRRLPRKDIHGNLKSTHPPHRGGHFFRCLSLLSLGFIPRRFFGGFDSLKPRKLLVRFLKRIVNTEVISQYDMQGPWTRFFGTGPCKPIPISYTILFHLTYRRTQHCTIGHLDSQINSIKILFHFGKDRLFIK